ncbi:hypothetical protein JCM10914_5284 [Paenibacillus sp. JCM 10914]|nr:hypothetical protein JCM10914_5284 [Paenibacillus sp. JCM 10914]
MMSLLVESVYLLAKLLYVLVVFRTDLHVDGIPPEGLLLFLGMHTVVTGIYMGMFFTNFTNISEYIKDGRLDLMLTKPVSLQFMASLRYVDLALPIPDIVVGLVMIGIGWHAMDIPLTLLQLGGFMLLLLVAVVITYCLMIIRRCCHSGSFKQVLRRRWPIPPGTRTISPWPFIRPGSAESEPLSFRYSSLPISDQCFCWGSSIGSM